MSTREIRVGKISGYSSYELAIKNGTFKGTLMEYLNKEQKYYNDMVLYGNNLKDTIATMVQPESQFQAYIASTNNIPSGIETSIFELRYPAKLFVNISAYVKFDPTNQISDGIMSIYINNNPVMRSPIVNNIASISLPYKVEVNDEIKISVVQSGIDTTLTESAINSITTERS